MARTPTRYLPEEEEDEFAEVRSADRAQRVGEAADYIADDEFLDHLGGSVEDALGLPRTPSAQPSETDRERRVGAAVDEIASPEFLEDLGDETDDALSVLMGGGQTEQPSPPREVQEQAQSAMIPERLGPGPSVADAEPDEDAVDALLDDGTETDEGVREYTGDDGIATMEFDPVDVDAAADEFNQPEAPTATASATPPASQVEVVEDQGMGEAARSLGQPPEGAEDLPPPDPDDDQALEAWDRRIRELEQLQGRAASRAESAAIRRLIQGLIGFASRYISNSSAARPYERGSLRSAVEGSRQQDSQAIADRVGEWSSSDQLRERTALERDRIQARAAEQEALSEYRQGQLGIRRDQLEARKPLDMARAGELGARQAHRERTTQQEADEVNPQSDLSNRSRTEFRMSMSTLPRSVMDAFADRIADLDNLSAREVDMLREDIDNFASGRIRSRSGGGAGGGGGQSPEAVVAAARTRIERLRQRQVVDDATAQAMIAGMSEANPRRRREVEAQIDALEGVQRTDHTQARQTASDAEDGVGTMVDEEGNATGVELLPGVRTSMDLVNQEPAAIRRDFTRFRTSMGHLGAIRQLIRENGGMAAFADPQVRAQIQRRLVPLRAMVTRIQETGIIQIGEREAIDAELPNPTQMTQQLFQTYMTNLQEWERIAMEAAVIALEDSGVLAQDRDRAVRLLRAPAGRARREGGSAPAAQRQGAPAAAPQAAPTAAGGDELPAGGTITGTTEGGRVITIHVDRLPEGTRRAGMAAVRRAAERQAGEPITWN